MKLGKRVQIVIGVPNLSDSAEFFTKLGFQQIDEGSEPYPWAQFSDGQNLILINQDGMVYRGLIYFNPALSDEKAKIEEAGVNYFWTQDTEDGIPHSAMFIDPTGIDGDGGERNIAVNIVNQDPSDLFRPSGKPRTKLGKFGEFAIPIEDFEASKAFWSKLGFTPVYESAEPYSWGIMMDGMIVMGLHASKGYESEGHYDFGSPAMTYFSTNSAERIAHLKELGIEMEFELKSPDGTIAHAGVKAPGGQLLFIFNGDI